jgi:putative Mg2+ transporter-C (MgtC) family protein
MSALQTILSTLQFEIESFWEIEQTTRVVWRMAMALALGAVIGWDRERRDAEAGLRTHMLVALGAALFVLVPLEAGMNDEQLSRVIQGLVSGIGFLGAGAVLKDSEEGRIHGLTTAATIWATAAVGIAVGLGHTGTAAIATVFMLLVLAWLRRLGKSIKRRRYDQDDKRAP